MRDNRPYAMLMQTFPAPSRWQRFRKRSSGPLLRAAVFCGLGAVPVLMAMAQHPEAAALWFGPLRFTVAMSGLALMLGVAPMALDRATRAAVWVQRASVVAAIAMVVQVALVLLSVAVHAVLPAGEAAVVQPVLCSLMTAASGLALVGPVVMGGALLRGMLLVPARRMVAGAGAVVVGMLVLQGQIVMALKVGAVF